VDAAAAIRASTARAGPGPGTPGAGVGEIGELVIAEHARILRLFGALDDLVRRGDPAAARLAQVWTRLTGLLVVHTRAEEEICFPLVSGTGPRALALAEAAIADHDDIRETVAEAELLKAGSLRWCQVVTAARTACAGHFADEERELLGYVCRSMPPETSKALVRQWASFAAAQAAGAGVRPGGIRAGRRERPKRPGPRRRTG
jgi:hypothetical protein